MSVVKSLVKSGGSRSIESDGLNTHPEKSPLVVNVWTGGVEIAPVPPETVFALCSPLRKIEEKLLTRVVF